MNAQKYLASLFKENKKCNCKYLTRLFFLEEKFNELENLCNDLLDSMLLTEKFDSNFKKVYEKKNYEKTNFYNELNLELNLLIKNGKLKLFYHNEKNNYQKELTNPAQGKKLNNKKKIISASCYKCAQQIGVL